MAGPGGPLAHRCGEWPSPLDADTLASAALRLSQPALGADGSLLWLEGRPGESGRTVLVRLAADDLLDAFELGATAKPVDVTPPPFDVRSRVYEGSGGAFTLLGDVVVFSDGKTSALYRARPGETPEVLTAPGADWRFADLTADPAHGRVLAVAERHVAGAPPENFLVAVDAATGAIDRLVAGADFYASPTPSPDGGQLAWISWNHPHMPWDAGALHVAELDAAGRPHAARHVAGDALGSAQQPGYARDGTLYFLLEATVRDGNRLDARWNLHRVRQGNGDGYEPIGRLWRSELGVPPWGLGTRTWDFVRDDAIIAAAVTDGQTALVEIDVGSGRVTNLPLTVAAVGHVAARGGRALLHAGLPDRPGGIVLVDRPAAIAGAEPPPPRLTMVRPGLPLRLEPAYVAIAEPVSFPTTNDETAHGWFYPPRNPRVPAGGSEKPPLVVMAHGGPTAAATPAFNPLVQFWTTRGIAVLDVNYRGSSGYGRRYRDRLRGQWGVYDVEDCAAGARALAASGRVDPTRIAIRGSSAGGYTTLAALCRPDLDVFTAGASLYGISDLETLARDTHKFESHYLESLIGPYPARADIYRARSPITHAERMHCPTIFFQGLDDRVVPPDQSERLVAALRTRNLPTELFTFAGEQHGFRRADTLRTVFSAELAFYGRVFGFTARSEKSTM